MNNCTVINFGVGVVSNGINSMENFHGIPWNLSMLTFIANAIIVPISI
jgi:hypothetical protein